MEELDQFNITCEQILTGKYILLESKISSLLKIIDETEKLKNIVSYCLNNFDFSNQFNNEISLDLKLPASEYEIVSFVYTFLYKYKNNSLNYGENSKTAVNQFIVSIIPYLQSAVNNSFNKNHHQIEADEFQQNVYNTLKQTIKLVLENLDKYKFNTTNKEEFLMLTNSLYSASEKNDKKLVYSLMIGLDYFTQCNKKLRSIYLALEECFSN